MKKHKVMKQKAVRYSISIGLVTLTIFFIMPYFQTLSNSFKSTQEILVSPGHLLLPEPTLSGYGRVLTQPPFFAWFKNGVFITVTSTVITLFTGALVGYTFSKFRFKRKRLLFVAPLASMMVPAQTTMIPSLFSINSLGLYNSAGALTLPSFVSALGIYLYKQFYDEIPGGFIENTKLDEAGDFTIFWKIIIPRIRPALGALTIFTFLNYWNDYLNPLTMLNEVEKMTLPSALSFFASQHMANLSAIMAASALITVSVTVVFMIFQKHFIKDIAVIDMK